jgi:hypothetical protein
MDYQPITDYFKNLRRVIRKFHDLSTEELQEILQADPSLYPVVIDLYALDIKLRHGIFDQHIHWKVLFPKPLSSYFPEEGSSEQEQAPRSNFAAKPSGRPRKIQPQPDVDSESEKAAREEEDLLRWRRQHRLGFFEMLGEELILEIAGEEHLHFLGKRKDIGIPEEPRGEIPQQAIIPRCK